MAGRLIVCHLDHVVADHGGTMIRLHRMAIIALLSAAGCRPTGTSDAHTVRDSAGVAVHESTAGLWDQPNAPPRWRVDVVVLGDTVLLVGTEDRLEVRALSLTGSLAAIIRGPDIPLGVSLTVFEIGADHVLGRTYNAQDVEHVVVLRLVRGSA